MGDRVFERMKSLGIKYTDYNIQYIQEQLREEDRKEEERRRNEEKQKELEERKKKEEEWKK